MVVDLGWLLDISRCVLRISVILLVALCDFEISFDPHIDLFGVAARLFTMLATMITDG